MSTQQVALDVTTDDGFTRTLTVQVEVEGKMPIGTLKEARHVFGHEKGSQVTTIISWGHRQTTKPVGEPPVNTVAPVVSEAPLANLSDAALNTMAVALAAATGESALDDSADELAQHLRDELHRRQLGWKTPGYFGDPEMSPDAGYEYVAQHGG